MHINVIMIPKNHEYIRRLKTSLEKVDISVQVLRPFHYSTMANIAKMLFYRSKGYEIVHVHWLYIFPLGLIMKCFHYFCRMMGMKVIWEVHNIIPHNASESDKKNSRWFYEKCDALIFHSERDLCRSREMLKTDASKVNIVIPHGNFNGSYENRISKEEARKRLSIPNEKRVILCFGFIRRNRGYEYLLEATENMENIEVVIAGKMLEKDVYEELLACAKTRKDVRIYGGFIPDNEVQVYFNACDLVVLPYTEITTSGVIPLAYSFSRPVITTDIGGLRDVVNKKTGILVPVADAHALRGAMERLFVADLEKMGKDAHDFAEKEFSWESNAQKIKRLYELITDSKLSKKTCKDEMIEKMVA